MSDKIKVAIVGVGYQGARAVPLLVEHGYDLVGAVDVGDKVGKPIGEVAGYADAPDIMISGSIEALFARCSPQVVLMCAAVPPPVAVDLTCQVLAKGVDIVSITEELFEGRGELAERVDAAARAHGGTIIPTGLQDVMWVQLPAVVAASVHNIRHLALSTLGDASIFSLEVAHEEAGIGLSRDDYAAWATPRLDLQPIQGAPLRELARVMGLEPGETRYTIDPIITDQPVNWPNAHVVLPAGSIIGTEYRVTFPTREGVTFEGLLTYKVDPGLVTMAGGCGVNTISIKAEMDIDCRLPSMPTDVIPLAMVRRIPHLAGAGPGLVRSSTLPITAYRPPVLAA